MSRSTLRRSQHNAILVPCSRQVASEVLRLTGKVCAHGGKQNCETPHLDPARNLPRSVHKGEVCGVTHKGYAAAEAS
jgi:hypothetical protein